jgi:CubicO group peptidase (beta-lactamase class C family)
MPARTAARPPRLDPERLDRAFELVRQQTADGRATYASLAVGRGDGPVRSATFADGEPTAPRRTAIASITKPITATAVLQLVESGDLVLIESLATYLPGFAPEPPADATAPADPISAWHLLTHTSGLADAPDEFYERTPPTRSALVDRYAGDRLRFLPGTAYAYTSDTFQLLAEVIERRTGVPYPEYLRSRVFEPLGMTATTFDPSEPGPEPLHLDGSFGPPGAPYDETIAYFITLAMAGGGLWSTADDVLRFGRAMLAGGTLDGTRVLGRPFVDLMTRDHTRDVRELGTGRRPDYGLGWGRPGEGRGSPASPSAFGHSGASGSMLIVDPDEDLVVVYLRNHWGVSMTATEQAIQAVYGALAD